MSRRWLLALLPLLLACPAEPGPTPPPSSGNGATSAPPPPHETPPDPQGPQNAQGPGRSQGPSPPQQPLTEEGRDQLAVRPKRQITVGGVPLTVYLVNTDESRQLGLMWVKHLPEAEGMLFVYPRAGRRSFWMHNTFIPLSLAYVAEDGTIDQLVDMRPLEDRTYPSRTTVRFVLEVNQGWFARHGVQEGAKVEGLTGLVGYE